MIISQKKDNFISVGIVIDDKINPLILENVHKYLNENYNYFEIILINYKINLTKNHYIKLLKQLTNIRIIELSSYVDIEIAHITIIENCIGDNCVIFDPVHDSLDDLAKMLLNSEEYDIVIGKREIKINSFFESITSKLFYKTISIFTGIKIDGMYSDFFIINRKVINFITKNEDRVKFLKLLKFNNGFSKYEHSYMPIGKKSNKRTFFENINFTIDILVNYSHRLIRLATILSISVSVFNLVYIIYVLGSYILKDTITEGWTSSNIYNATMYFILFLVLSILGEYVRMILQNQKKLLSMK